MLEDKINEDYKQAMKNKDAAKVSTLSFLRSQLKYVIIEKKTEKEKLEMSVLKSYLPAEMPLESLKGLVAEVIQQTSASGVKDMGKVMKELLPKVAGKADSKVVSDLVKELLSKA